jgi:anthranilate/para-aminobenzoate synthase component I
VDASVTIRTLVASLGRIEFGAGATVSDPDEAFEQPEVPATALSSFVGREFPGSGHE